MEEQIDLRALRKIAVSLIDSAARELGSEVVPIDGDTDHYWEVPLELQHAVKEGPPALDVGRLTDDWGFLKSTANDPGSATPLNLLHLAPLLNYLALRVTQGK